MLLWRQKGQGSRSSEKGHLHAGRSFNSGRKRYDKAKRKVNKRSTQGHLHSTPKSHHAMNFFWQHNHIPGCHGNSRSFIYVIQYGAIIKGELWQSSYMNTMISRVSPLTPFINHHAYNTYSLLRCEHTGDTDQFQYRQTS